MPVSGAGGGRICAVIAAVLTMVGLGARAAPAAPAVGTAPAAARHKVVLAPLATLGSESSSSEVRAADKVVSRGLAALDTVELIGTGAARAAIRRARRPQLRACDGEAGCLADLGQLMGAEYTVYGEVGGLGSAQVVYLKLVDARARREIRSTVLELGGERDMAQKARAAATRLIAPGRYVGELLLTSNVGGASVYVDGEMVAHTPARRLSLPVGPHALRVTHPEYRDFVRFVDIDFGTTTTVPVELASYAAVAGDIRKSAHGPFAPGGPVQPTPWYRRWYTIAGGAAVLLITSAVIVGATSGGISVDRTHELP